MRFNFAGSQYQLEFQRAHRDVELRRRVAKTDDKGEVTVENQTIVQPSQHPYTTVRLDLVQEDGKTIKVAEASVGCAPTDKYGVGAGRIWALRKLTDRKTGIQDKAFRKAIWEAHAARAGKK